MNTEYKALIDHVINSKKGQKLMKQPIMRISKNSVFSEAVRKQGNDLFQSSYHHAQIHEDIWKYYSMSIAVAEKDSEALAIAYGNRSVILIHLEKYEECLKDIDRAIKITKSKPYIIKLLCRKGSCLHVLGSEEKKYPFAVAEAMLEKVEDKTAKKNLKELIKRTKTLIDEPVKQKEQNKNAKDITVQNLEKLYEKHAVNDFSAVEIQHDKKWGRHLVATRDIKPGEVIYVEEPYTKFLNIKKLHAYCSHCFNTTWTNIPCDHCSWTMFCSEACKKDAWEKYHDIECPVYACSKSDTNDTYKQLAVRCLILGIKEAGSVENLKAELKSFDECQDVTKGFLKDEKIETMGFKSIYALSKVIPLNSLQIHLDNTAVVLRGLAKNTSLLGENCDIENSKSLKKSESATFLGALFLRLSKIAQLNQHQMWNANSVCRMGLTRLECWKNECCSRGVYLAPITALLNHSCDPNARRCYSHDHKVIVYATKPIKKGSQIFDCYQEEFYERGMTKELGQRCKVLSSTYGFDCDCEACEKKWPHLIDLAKRYNTNAKNKPIEKIMSLEYKDIIPSTLSQDKIFQVKELLHVANGIDKSLVILDQPSFLTINLIICMNTIFERLYGIKLDVPRTCSNV